ARKRKKLRPRRSSAASRPLRSVLRVRHRWSSVRRKASLLRPRAGWFSLRMRKNSSKSRHSFVVRRTDGIVSRGSPVGADRKSTRLNSSHVKISYAVFCLKKKKKAKTFTPRLQSREILI